MMAPEGQLAPRFNALVRKETCADVAREIDLGAVLKLGKSEMKTGGRRKNALLGDAMEAVIAAVYRDAGYEVGDGSTPGARHRAILEGSTWRYLHDGVGEEYPPLIPDSSD